MEAKKVKGAVGCFLRRSPPFGFSILPASIPSSYPNSQAPEIETPRSASGPDVKDSALLSFQTEVSLKGLCSKVQYIWGAGMWC